MGYSPWVLKESDTTEETFCRHANPKAEISGRDFGLNSSPRRRPHIRLNVRVLSKSRLEKGTNLYHETCLKQLESTWIYQPKDCCCPGFPKGHSTDGRVTELQGEKRNLL